MTRCEIRRVLAAGTTSVLLAACLFAAQHAAAQHNGPPTVGYEIKLDVALQQLSDEFCWFHPRPTPILAGGAAGSDALLTLQKHLHVSDFYSGLWTMRTRDGGQTWEGPTEIPELGWRHEGDVIIGVADVTPGWHQPSQRVIALGAQIRYSARGRQLEDVARAHQTAYAVFDPKTDAWTAWRTFEMPDDEKFDFARNACSQWLVRPDGTLLVPVYFSRTAGEPFSVTVVRCSFDGSELKYLGHGDELSLNVVRGLCEPSIIFCQGQYFLTIRNDLKGYVTSIEDGLAWKPIQPWTFNDGLDLGSYNTQQHWLAHSDGLFLVYTRRGANNDHVTRHRAPLFIAQVDVDKLCVIRDTERVLIPERGAAMGNFGAGAISPRESWVTVGEYMGGGQPHPRGADGSVFVARVIWDRPNRLVEVER